MRRSDDRFSLFLTLRERALSVGAQVIAFVMHDPLLPLLTLPPRGEVTSSVKKGDDQDPFVLDLV